MSENMQDGIDLDGREELAGPFSAETYELALVFGSHESAEIGETRLAYDHCSRCNDALRTAHLIVAKGWRSPAVVAGLVAEVESLTEQRNNASAEVHRLNPLLDTADRRLGAVAALADEWEKTGNEHGESSKVEGISEDTAERRIILGLMYKGNADRIRAVLAPVSGAVEGGRS